MYIPISMMLFDSICPWWEIQQGIAVCRLLKVTRCMSHKETLEGIQMVSKPELGGRKGWPLLMILSMSWSSQDTPVWIAACPWLKSLDHLTQWKIFTVCQAMMAMLGFILQMYNYLHSNCPQKNVTQGANSLVSGQNCASWSAALMLLYSFPWHWSWEWDMARSLAICFSTLTTWVQEKHLWASHWWWVTMGWINSIDSKIDDVDDHEVMSRNETNSEVVRRF